MDGSAIASAGPAPLSIGALTYAQFEQRLTSTGAKHHIPISGQLELTYRCNFECVHCYEQGMREQAELSGSRWCELIDQLADLGCLWLTLTGGEAILHPEFERIYEHAIRRGLLVTVFSNGSTLTERIDQLFRRLPPRTIEVTLYGFSAETYAKSTGRPRGFEQAIDGVRRMHAAGHRLQVKTVAMRETVADFHAIKAFAAELGVDFRYDTNLHAALDGGEGPKSHRLSPEEIVQLESTDAGVFEGIRERHGTPQSTGVDRVYRCGAGRYAFTIAPDGFLQLCTLIRSLRFDLATTSFTEAWTAMGNEVGRRYDSKTRRCSGCQLQHMCGTCPGVAEVEGGDVEAAIDHICETTHLRASAALGRSIVPAWKKLRPSSTKLPVLGQETTHARQASSCGSCVGCSAHS
jgi:radical SAM protein with 4Fe4S-binding SPASM domain